LSGAVGAVIQTGVDFWLGGWEEVIDTTENAKECLSSALPDVTLPYATLLWFTEKVKY
jgi:hypothetical protein